MAITIARDAPPVPLPPVASAACSPRGSDDGSTAEQTYMPPEMASTTAEVATVRAPFDGLNASSLPEEAERRTTELSTEILPEQNTAAETAAATRIQVPFAPNAFSHLLLVQYEPTVWSVGLHVARQA